MQSLILKADEEKRELLAVVHRAGVRDSQEDEFTKEELHLASMRFATSPRPGIEHDDEKIPAGVVVIIGTYMTSEKYKASGVTIPKHAWIMQCKVAKTPQGDVIWQRIKAGRRGEKFITINGKEYPTLTGFSMAGSAVREKVE